MNRTPSLTVVDELDSGSTQRNSLLPLGFTPMRNKRIEAAIALVAMRLLKEGKISPDQVRSHAVQQVARSLPALPFRRLLRLPRPSKNDCPIYRKQACRAA